MANGKQKLELNWIGKERRPQLEPRILQLDNGLSYHATERRSPTDRFDNILVQGDNLLALKALEGEFAGRVKCIYIDPPYNTGSAFAHYDDGLEHSTWLTLIRDRLEALSRLLALDGTIWITIDDNEAHYLKVVCDEVFGRSNFVANAIWQKKYSRQNDAQWFSTSHDHILVYASDKEAWEPNRIERTQAQLKGYNNPDDDPRGPWTSVVYTCAKTRSERPNLYYPITRPSDGQQLWPSESRVWGYEPETHRGHASDNRLWWGKKGELDKPRLKVFLSEVGGGVVPDTLWLRDDVGDNQEAKREALSFNDVDTFSTPKPEKLIARILEIATEPGDVVLDSFAGSGTTGAVAQKMGRRWIMVEQGDHAVTHIVPRLRKVVDGTDPGGVTEAAEWKGGGGYRFFRLAPSLLEKDQFDNWVISKKYDAAMLAEAMCKHMGFTYAPSTQHYWMQGYSSERDFIYVTTQSLPHDQLRALSDLVGPDRSLLVCCKAFQGKHVDEFKNLTVKKIPHSILHRCEWGKDDYSVEVAALAPVEPAALVVEANGQEPEPEEPPRPKRKRKKKAEAPETPMLDFDGEEA